MSTSCSVQRMMFFTKPRTSCPQTRRFSPRHSSDLSHLHEEMIARKLPFITDHMTPLPTTLLKKTLVDFIPYPNHHSNRVNKVPIGHHLVYFPSQTLLSSLLPDGTDPLHSPGPPFTRRMWAGGSMIFYKPLKVDFSAYHVKENIVDVQFKGEGDERKVFVTIKRFIHRGNVPGELTMDNNSYVVEGRDIVFMCEKPRMNSTEPRQSAKVLKPTKPPDFSIRVTPTPAMLFRFSALTFNAHAIHLDKKYCQEIEGHRNLLVHGPLTLVLLLEVLKLFLTQERGTGSTRRRFERIMAVDYRNLAPLYAEEEMNICVRRKTQGRSGGSFDVWIEGKDGGYAVKGLVSTYIDGLQEEHIKRPSMFDKGNSIDKDFTVGGDTDSNKEGAFVDEVATEDETILERKEASVDEISTGDETIPEENDDASSNGVDKGPAPYSQR